jgi:transposase
MARYKHIDTHPKLLPVDLLGQLLPGTFEHALHHLVEHELDLSHFDARFQNDETGAPAFPPGLLLKVVLFAYAQGMVSSRQIARACQTHVTFIALCGDQAPHFTTIARFVSTLGEDIARVFAAVLAVCDQQGLIGRAMFAIDGVKLPSNASKHRSGTRADFARQAAKLEAAATTMLQRHRAMDQLAAEPTAAAKTLARVERLQRDATQLREWLAAHPEDRRGARGSVRKSNRTDNDSAKMATSKGVIQGYTAVAAVDAAHQIIIEAQAHGTGSEHELLVPIVEATAAVRTADTLITADAGYHSAANLAQLADRGIPALIADRDMRQRDARFATQGRYRTLPDPLHDKSAPPHRASVFTPGDFIYDPVARTCVCPAGKRLYRKGRANVTGGFVGEHFRGAKRDCEPCTLRAQCLRTPDTTPVRNVAFFRGLAAPPPRDHSAAMRARLDSPTGRVQYAQRFGTVEPVFGNLRANKRLDRFTLRGRPKVDAQWKLYCLVHNIEKLAKAGYAA